MGPGSRVPSVGFHFSGMPLRLQLDWIGLDWNAVFHVDKIVEKQNQINEYMIQVLAHINRYV